MNPIAVIPKGTTHRFWKAVEGGAREGAREAGVEMTWKGSLNRTTWRSGPCREENDPAQQIQSPRRLADMGPLGYRPA